jgi:hypothetical protein
MIEELDALYQPIVNYPMSVKTAVAFLIIIGELLLKGRHIEQIEEKLSEI